MIHELKTTEAVADRRIRLQTDPASASAAHANAYERPGANEANLAQRAAYARDVYADLFGGTPMARPSADKLDESQFQIVDLSQDKPAQTFHFHITGLPEGARVRAKSTTPGVTVAATVGQSSLGHDTI
jgi:hypothetical protein